jgi:hypothetical protein
MGFLMVLTALGGATTIVTGVMLVAGTVNLDDFDNGITTKQLLHDHPWWYALFGALLVAGIVAQIAFRDKVARSLREAWTDAGGRQLRTV